MINTYVEKYEDENGDMIGEEDDDENKEEKKEGRKDDIILGGKCILSVIVWAFCVYLVFNRNYQFWHPLVEHFK